MILERMPEGDTIAIAARRLEPLVGRPLEVVARHPRSAGLQLERRLAGERLTRVETRGKHLLLHVGEALVLHVHLRMTGRVDIGPRGRPFARAASRAWLVLRTDTHEAVLFDGPVLELLTPAMVSLHPVLRRLGPDVLASDFDARAAAGRLCTGAPDRAIGAALLDQRLLAGVGNVWRSEALHAARVHPLCVVHDVADIELVGALAWLADAMSARVAGQAERPTRVYRRTGRPCGTCGALVVSAVVGEEGRRAYWCETCQPPPAPAPI